MPATRHKDFAVSATADLDKRQVVVVCSTGQVDRAGDVLVQKGISFQNFMAYGTVLRDHDYEKPVARCIDIGVRDGNLEATAQFPDEGISRLADETLGLIRAGVINAVSIGFLPLESEPVDGKSARKGLRFTQTELLEFSFVSVPANPGAGIVQRALERGDLKVKSLYDVAELAYALMNLGWIQSSLDWEAEYEGDGSDVPARLAAALAELGAILVDLTAEEVGEMLAPLAGGDAKAAGLGLVKAMQARTKAGAKFSAATRSLLDEACKSIVGGHDMIRSMLDTEADPEPENKTAKPGTTRAAASPAKAALARSLRRLAVPATV